MSTVGPTKADYSVAWMCAFSFELKAAATMLDRTYESPLSAQNDPNIYIFGCIREHNVILTCLPPGQFGTSSSARTATILKSNFPSIQVVFLVGIGGGVPSSAHDIRLGDVVVSLPSGPHGGVVRYDFGKRREGVAIPIQYSRAPPSIVLSAIARLQITHMSYPERAGTFLSEALENNPQLQKWRDKAASDLLFHNDYVHERGSSSAGNRDQDHLIQRPQRMDTNPRVHFGTIASGNSVIMDGMTRDRISENLGGVLCFEMEAAGILNSLPCLVIRGISDYADSHKDKAWHEWAATAAAATAKEILSFIPAPGLKASHTVWDFTELHNAAKQEDEETVERLLQGGADVNGKDSEGNTPMHYAAMNGRKDIVSLLLAYNADDTITNSLGRSARDLATENGYPDVSAFLVDPPVTIKSTSKRREDREKIVQGAPSMEDRCNEACKAFDARVVLSFENKESLKLSKRWQIPIYDLLYSEDHDRWKEILEQWRSESQSKDQSAAHDALRWVHLPANNMLWVKDLIRRVCYSERKTEREHNSMVEFVDESLYAYTDSTLHACYREPSFHAKHEKLSMVLPYLDMESEQYLNRDLRPQSSRVNSMHNLIAQYEVTSDIYVSRTLDQSYYYAMEDTRERDLDQVVYRYTKKKGSKTELAPGRQQESKLLMVNQFWLWKVDEHTIITSCPERWHEGAEEKILGAILYPQSDMVSTIGWICHIAFQCINFPEEPHKAGLSERYTRIFAMAIATTSDAEARCFASFTKAIPNGTVSQINIEEEIQLLQEIIRLLREIKDIRDELNMLSRVLHDQLDIMDKVSLWIGQEIPVHREWGIEARLTQIIRMDGDAERVEKSLNHLLDFKQKQSNIEEARLSRTQAEDTALQGKYLFVFTVVTVIFTPLSFMAALFAIQIKEFPQDDKGLSFDGRWIGKYMAAGEFATIGVILLITIVVLGKHRIEAFFQRSEKDSPKDMRVSESSRKGTPTSSRRKVDESRA